MPTSGVIHGIYISPAARRELAAVGAVRAVPGRGLEGDRYFDGVGSFSRWAGSGRAVTLIEQEVIDAVAKEFGLDLSAGRSRRNLVTSGVALADLDGRKFRIGGALLRGARLCAPCRYLERLLCPPTFDALRGRGGLRADVWEQGVIRLGDEIRPE